MNVGGVDIVGTATITAATNVLALTAHGLADGDLVAVDTLVGGGAELRENSTYVVRYIDANSFRLSTPSGAAAFDFTADGSARVLSAVPSYSAVDLRRMDAVMLHPGSTDRLGAREGVRPHSTDAVTVAGTTWTAAEGVTSVYPRETSTSAAYRVVNDATSGALDPADGSNPRLDGIDLQVQDDDEDGSGFRRGRIVYVVGTPASSPPAPAVTVNAFRLATILVPAGGSPTPSISTPGQYGWGAATLPVRGTSERPTTGLYHGAKVWRQDTETEEVWTGAAWEPLASTTNYTSIRRIATTIRTTNTSSFTAETLINSVTASLVNGATYRVTWDATVTSSVAADIARSRLRENNISGTQLQLRNIGIPGTGAGFIMRLEAEYTAVSTGSKTFAATCQRITGTGNLSCNANANEPQYLYVDYLRG